MDITVHNIIKEKEDIKFDGIEYMPSKLTYYNFALLVAKIIRHHHNIVAEIASYRSRIKEAEKSIVDMGDMSEFDVMNINNIKKGLVDAFNNFRASEKQVKMYVQLYNIINKCYDKCVSWCKGLTKDDIMKMVFAGTGIEIIETDPNRYQRSLNNTQADIKTNTASEAYNKMFQFDESKHLGLKTDEQDQSYRIPPQVYDTEMKDDINTFINSFIETGILTNIFYDDREEIFARIEAEEKARLEALRKQQEEEEKELENDEIMQILNLFYNNEPEQNNSFQNAISSDTSSGSNNIDIKAKINNQYYSSSTSGPVVDDNVVWQFKEKNRYTVHNLCYQINKSDIVNIKNENNLDYISPKYTVKIDLTYNTNNIDNSNSNNNKSDYYNNINDSLYIRKPYIPINNTPSIKTNIDNDISGDFENSS